MESQVDDGKMEELMTLLRRAKAVETKLERAVSTATDGSPRIKVAGTSLPGTPQSAHRLQQSTSKASGRSTRAHRAPRTPLEAALLKFRDAEEAFLAEKGALRREADAQRKRATRAEQELAQLQGMHKYKLGELASLKRALKARDEEIGLLQGRLQDQQQCAEGRDTLQQVLDATLARLEAAIAAVQGQEARVGELLKQVEDLTQQRDALLRLWKVHKEAFPGAEDGADS